MNIYEFKDSLVRAISANEKVLGIGQTGDIQAPLVAGQSDIDLFVICTEIPTPQERIALYRLLISDETKVHMNVSNGGLWGFGDILDFQCIDVMPMYFTVVEMRAYLEDVLQGNHLERVGRFYPIGRLASIETLNILYEKEHTWTTIVDRVKEYPEDLFRAWCQVQSVQILDEEDISRVILRKEILFYHQVLEEAIDHMLQALYAINRRYFPSRKRTEQTIQTFQYTPEDFVIRLRSIINKSVSEAEVAESVAELRMLTKDIIMLGKLRFLL